MKKRMVFLGLFIGFLTLCTPSRGYSADYGELAYSSDTPSDSDEQSNSPVSSALTPLPLTNDDAASENPRQASDGAASENPRQTNDGAASENPHMRVPLGDSSEPTSALTPQVAHMGSGSKPTVAADQNESPSPAHTNSGSQATVAVDQNEGGDSPPHTPSPPLPPGHGSDTFTDIVRGSYCDVPVYWAVSLGITVGTTDTTFSPKNPCLHRHILAFLYRKEGCPPVEGADSDNIFVLSELWAKERGLIPETGFNGYETCTRSEAMMYIWRLSGSPLNGFASFDDVAQDAEYERAVAWAVDFGVTKGITDTTFSPDAPCTRGQIVTLLYRWANPE